MARKLRIEYPGAIYHVLNRGDRRESIFRDDVDHQVFLATLNDACIKADWQVHAYCLMGNHFHLVLETPRGNLVSGMKWFLGTYTQRFNRRHGLSGHLFSGRYKSLLIESDRPGYLGTVCEYVHLNPVRAHLISPTAPLQSYPWSSYPAYLEGPRERPAWLRVDRVLGGMGILADTAAGRRQLAQAMEARRQDEDPEKYAGIRRGWCWGDDSFRKDLLARMGGGSAGGPSGDATRESAFDKAERLLKAELARLGWGDEDLAACRKGDPAKVLIAQRLRSETTMTLKWIAEHLRMGTPSSLANLLAASRNAGGKPSATGTAPTTEGRATRRGRTGPRPASRA